MLLIGFEFNIFWLIGFEFNIFMLLAISNTIKCGNHSALQIVWVENSTWEMFVTMEIWLVMDQMLNSLAVVSLSFPICHRLYLQGRLLFIRQKGCLNYQSIHPIQFHENLPLETGWFSTYRIVHIWNFLRWTFCM